MERLIGKDDVPVEGEFTHRHGFLRIPDAERRFWTPYLELTLEESEGDRLQVANCGTRLWCTFSPRPEIWTGFVFAIGTLLVLSIFASIYGVAQLMLSRPPAAFWIPIGAIVFALGLYASALIGQGLSLAQMYRLRAFVDACIREAESEIRHPPEVPSGANQGAADTPDKD